MKRDDVLEIANRLKSEGRAISPVTVCLEAYGQSLPEIAATLQQWREERIAPVDSALAALPTPEDFGDVMRDAIERCWAVAQKSVRGQVDAEIRALKERAEQAERETGMLYIDLTRTLNELESCKLKVAELQHSATGATRMIAARDADTVLPIADRSTATSNEAPTEPEINPAAFDEQAPVVEELAYQPHLDSAAIDKHPMTDSSLGAPRPFDETGTGPALEETAQTPAPEPDLTVEPAERFNEFAPQVLLPELDSVDGLAEELALAETRALAAEARVQDLEAQLANAAQSANSPANDSTGVQAAQEAAQRIAEMEATFAQERQTLQTRLDEANLESTQWKQRAGQLRIEFAPLKEHAAWLSAQSVGRSALCSRLIVELARVSPGNLLLRKEVQQQIVDQAAQNHTG
ncbi:DNA-binding protein [Paraburkholderia caffeinilytica]|uniref:KfrA N-terminal DNA-binding domain-containing protein n=1 Tax=Paraburkholderia caffeinilytica TaxID=1761016 RepID=A0ABQ1LKZ0_9BURK|nr:DNA-binding protein [Paraburkholderia caffeinilytica]GGC26121.1 hypothetical protein GCM10011400_10680 [Paraburkholderia caffeinilytica]